jgi:hypothetical protein
MLNNTFSYIQKKKKKLKRNALNESPNKKVSIFNIYTNKSTLLLYTLDN